VEESFPKPTVNNGRFGTLTFSQPPGRGRRSQVSGFLLNQKLPKYQELVMLGALKRNDHIWDRGVNFQSVDNKCKLFLLFGSKQPGSIVI
jgi:hypothetical protein